MKNLQRMCAATVLTCVFAVAVSAGDMHAGAAPPPPPPPPTSPQQADGETPFGLLALIEALLSVL